MECSREFFYCPVGAYLVFQLNQRFFLDPF